MTTRTTTRTTTTTTRTRTRTRRRTRSNNNDDNEDAARSMSCPQVQMKSPSLFPSPDPYRHRRCAKLYNNLRLPPKASGNATGPGPAPGFMRLTPDSRAPAKADPWKVCVGCNPCPCSGSQARQGSMSWLWLLCWWLLLVWCYWRFGGSLNLPCVRRGPGLRASRQHPSSEGGWQPGCTWRTPKSGEPSCTLSLRKREKQASTLATFVVTRGRCEPISSSGPSYCLLSLNPSQWSRV